MKRESITIAVEIPEEINAKVENKIVEISKGDNVVERKFRSKLLTLEKENNSIKITVKPGNRKTNAIMKTVAAHIKNMITGVEKGYEYKLAVKYSHFPMTVKVEGKIVEVSNFMGGKKTRKIKIIGEATKVEVKGQDITVKGPNKEHVAQTAANLELGTGLTDKDLRIFQDGIYLVQKGTKSD